MSTMSMSGGGKKKVALRNGRGCVQGSLFVILLLIFNFFEKNVNFEKILDLEILENLEFSNIYKIVKIFKL